LEAGKIEFGRQDALALERLEAPTMRVRTSAWTFIENCLT
jgi:hypothetical protein